MVDEQSMTAREALGKLRGMNVTRRNAGDGNWPGYVLMGIIAVEFLTCIVIRSLYPPP